jgi:thiamine-monophosphate kinase
MGATPTAIFVAIALPPSFIEEDWHEFYRGLAVPCKPYKVKLLGGDTSSSPTSLFIAITIMGHAPPGHILTRHGARKGDLIYVSGTLGDSAAGLAYLKKYQHPPRTSSLPKSRQYLVHRHLHPTPRITLGQLLASRPFASATLDLSDGLSGDLRHLCDQSQVGALIYSTHIPMSEQIKNYAKKIRTTPLHWALHGGEDYELLFTLPPKWKNELEKMTKKCRIPITKIGAIQPKQFGIRIEQSDRTRNDFPAQSYEHYSQ